MRLWNPFGLLSLHWLSGDGEWFLASSCCDLHARLPFVHELLFLCCLLAFKCFSLFVVTFRLLEASLAIFGCLSPDCHEVVCFLLLLLRSERSNKREERAGFWWVCCDAAPRHGGTGGEGVQNRPLTA